VPPELEALVGGGGGGGFRSRGHAAYGGGGGRGGGVTGANAMPLGSAGGASRPYR
jgi:hypothetical protein